MNLIYLKYVFIIFDGDQLQTDPKKEKFLINYRRNLINFARCGKSKSISLFTEKEMSNRDSNNSFLIQEEVLEETVVEKYEKIRPKIIQKLQLHLFQGKIKEVLQFGQILIEGNQTQTASLKLCNPSLYWTNTKILNKRISPNSIKVKEMSPSQYEFETVTDYKSKPILDYILKKESFTPDKIPLLFVYTTEISSSNIEFLFKYKISEKWQSPLTDIEICVYLNPDFMVSGDCKTIPMAVSLRNHKIVWKTKEISQAVSPKGKIILAFTSSNVPPKKIIKEIKLSMKCENKGLLQGLEAECVHEDQYAVKAEKSLLISYKVQAND